MHRRTPAALLAAAALLLAAGCAAQHPAPRPAAVAPPACVPPPDAVLPHTAGSLTEAQTGTYCLAVGDRLTVFLTATQGKWTQVTSSGPTVLAAVPAGMLTAPIGVTPAVFRAASVGTAQLSSRDGTGRSWRATVVVR